MVEEEPAASAGAAEVGVAVEEGVEPQEMEDGSSQLGLSWGVWGMTRESAWEMHKVKSQVFLFATLWS